MKEKLKINEQDPKESKSKSDFRLDALIIIALSIVCVILSTMKTAGVGDGIKSIVDPAVFVVIILGYTIIKNAILYLCKGKISSDFLMSLAIIATFALGVLVALNKIESDKNYFFVSAVLAIISNAIYYVQKTIFFKANYDTGITKIKIVEKAKKLGNVLAIIAIVLCGVNFALEFFIFQSSLAKCIEKTVCVLVVFAPTSVFLGAVFSVCSARKRSKKRGIIYKDIDRIEKFAKLKTVIFDDDVLVDKTYTVEKVLGFDKDKKDVLNYATAIYKKEDSFSLALTKICATQLDVSDRQSFEGCEKGVIGNGIVEICTPKYLFDNYNYDVSSKVRSTYSVLFVVENGLVIGAILFGIKTKEYAKELIDRLKSLKVKTVLLSSNTLSQAKAVQKECGVEEVYGDLTKKDKEYRVVSAKINNNGDTLLVSNGEETTGADYLLQLVCDLILENSDIVSNDEKVKNFPYSFKVLRRVFSKIKFSIILNFVVSAIAAALIVLGFIDWMIAGAVFLLLNLLTFLISR